MFGLFKKKKKANSVMKLRGFPGDLGTMKCLVMAAEKQVKIEASLLDIHQGQQDQDEYRQHSAFGKYPLLQEDDAISVGTEAALSYIDTRGTGLMNPKKAQHFGHQNYWWQVADSIGTEVQALIDEAAFGTQANVDLSVIETALDSLDKALTGKKCIVGEYSYADVHWTALLHALELTGKQSLIEARSNLKTWFDSIKQRPSYASLPSLESIKQKQLNAA